MSRFRFVVLSLSFIVAGVACYVLVGQDRMQDVGVIALMFTLVAWFYSNDWEIDSYKS